MSKEKLSNKAQNPPLSKGVVRGSFLDPISWVVKVYGRSKLDYLSDNLIGNDTWWEIIEAYGKYVKRYVRKNYR
jgi:hypothetical protein